MKCEYDDSLTMYDERIGLDCTKWFAESLLKIATDLDEMFKNDAIPKHLSQEPVISILFHNLSKFDAHIIIRAISKYIPGHMNVLPATKESYISFTKHVENKSVQLRFIDSYRFLSESLGTLTSYLSGSEMPILDSQFPNISAEQKILLKRKGVFPYDYIDSMEKLNDRQLPKIEEFYSILNDEGISQSDYIHGQNVWTKFHIDDMREYALLYMKLDIVLLAQIFENFRNTCMESYKLDVAHYYSLPGMTIVL